MPHINAENRLNITKKNMNIKISKFVHNTN